MSQIKVLLDICLQKNLNFVAYSLPNKEGFEVIIEHHLLCSNVKSGFVFHPFEVSSDNPEVLIHADFRTNSGVVDNDFIEEIKKLPAIPVKEKAEELIAISKEEYLEHLHTGIEKLKNKELNKFIFSRIHSLKKPTNFSSVDYMLRLQKKLPTAFVYLLNHENAGTWMGATPETLINWKGKGISTMALAGTQPNTGVKPNWSPKEIEEQAYVTSYIEKAFTNNNIQYQKSDVETVAAGPVFHLKTNISSTQNVNFEQAENLTKAFHPTPAVCGVPLQKAKELIANLEPHYRSYYTGYLGILNPNKELNLFVNLRCLQVLPNSLALYLGGGITANSNAEKEWDETNFKAETLLGELH